MGEQLAIETRMSQAETRWGLQFKRQGRQSACSPCPFCKHLPGDLGADENGFVLFPNGWYFCRKCNKSGWLDENDTRPLTAQEIADIQMRSAQHKAREQQERLTAIEQMARCTDHLRYHKLLEADDMACLWYQEGFTDALVDQYHLGICHNCPTAAGLSSLTIPVINGGQLVNIRHRLLSGDNGNKYRPHRAGLGNTLFLADAVYSEDTSSILIVEGEKKAIIAKDRIGGNVTGTMGKAGFQKAWASRFLRFSEVLIALDPDATEKANEMATWFGDRARVVALPTKPDDFFVRYHGTADQFRGFLRLARRAQK